MKKSHLILAFTLLVSHLPALELDRLVKPETLTKHRETLGLTTAQETRLTQVYEPAKAEAVPLEEVIREQQGKLNEMLRQETLQAGDAEAQFAALLESEGALKRLQFRTLLAIREVLTPEQVAAAVALENRDRQRDLPLQARIETKASQLKAAFEELGIKAPPLLKERGERITELIQAGDLEAAGQALEELGREAGIEEVVDLGRIDFVLQPTGDTSGEVLKARFAAVEAAVQRVISIPLLRQLVQARDTLEVAKASEDAELAGRVLSWAESVLGLNPAGN